MCPHFLYRKEKRTSPSNSKSVICHEIWRSTFLALVVLRNWAPWVFLISPERNADTWCVNSLLRIFVAAEQSETDYNERLARHTNVFYARSYSREKRRPSVRTYQRGSHWTDFRETWYSGLLWKPSRKIQMWLKSGKNIGPFKWRPKCVL